MKVLLVANFSDRRCGYQNFAVQTETAFRRAGFDLTTFDGTYSRIYARQQDGLGIHAFLPPDTPDYDVVHLIWSAQTMNHYTGAQWPEGPLLSIWDGGPSDAYCPFMQWMSCKWTCYDRSAEGYYENWYPIPDWVDDLPAPDEAFTVGCSSVRGDGVAEVRDLCARRGWAVNLPSPGQWVPLEDEIRRLARSTVNVSWYRTSPIWKDRAGAPSTALASRRPFLKSDDSLLGHLEGCPDLYHGIHLEHGGDGLEGALARVYEDWKAGRLLYPSKTVDRLSWTRSVALYADVWRYLREERH